MSLRQQGTGHALHAPEHLRRGHHHTWLQKCTGEMLHALTVIRGFDTQLAKGVGVNVLTDTQNISVLKEEGM